MKKDEMAVVAVLALAVNYFGMEAMAGGRLVLMPAAITNALMVSMFVSSGVTFIGLVAMNCMLGRHAAPLAH